MKKRHKGYFKKPTDIYDKGLRDYITTKRTYSHSPKFRMALWCNLYLRENFK